jgi:methylated-DNA-[protein]-cysteine S-methyltransferase
MRKRIITPTPFGPLAVIWNEIAGALRIVRVLLSSPAAAASVRASALYPDASFSSCAEIDSLCASLAAFLEGEEVVFSLEAVALDDCPAFQRSVLMADHAIGRGRVGSYGLLAARAGSPGGARAAGNALADNPFPIIVPCHRVIRADRSLGGFTGGGVGMKRALLRMEGISFDAGGRAIVSSFNI